MHEVVTEGHEIRGIHKIDVGKEIVRIMKYVEQEEGQQARSVHKPKVGKEIVHGVISKLSIKTGELIVASQ